MNNKPKWVVMFYLNILSENKFTSKSRLFFDDESAAQLFYDQCVKANSAICKRPYYDKIDCEFLGYSSDLGEPGKLGIIQPVFTPIGGIKL